MLGVMLALVAGALLIFIAQVPVQVPISPSAAPGDLVGRTWMWTRTDQADGSVVQPTDPTRYTLTLLDSGRATIRADCNTGSGAFSLDDHQLRLQPIAITLIACPPGSSDGVFLRDLQSVASYALDG